MMTLSLTDGVAWDFREAATARWREARVPGCVHRDLLKHGAIPDPFVGRNEHAVQWVSDRTWEYRGRFVVTAGMIEHEEVELVADGLDTLATVEVNGEVAGRSENMFVGRRFSVRRFLRVGRNEVVMRFESATRYIETHRQEHRPREINDPVGGCTRIRKEQCQFGWDWAPRLVTAGIWRELRLEAWSVSRLAEVRVTQRHARDGSVTLEFAPEIVGRRGRLSDVKDYSVTGAISWEGRDVARVMDGKAVVDEPRLWWPSGQGEQARYAVKLEVRTTDGELVGRWEKRIGLRTIAVERKRDRWGESFQLVVNGRRIFAKGASWIPAHSFVGGLTRADYEPLLRAAVEANMNMLRVWGGGIYEHECFYDLCDELGLLVWQDFMFACTLYPGDAAFLKSVREEAEYQVRRLRNRTCLAMWCGNNELELLNGADLEKPKQRVAYDAVFREILPEAVAAFDGATTYWRSSPSQSEGRGLGDPERSGNTHYWDVWHVLKPVKSYEAKVFRFVSEFGMQSFPSRAVADTFCGPGGLNIFSPGMENHQKNPMGNRIILEYVARRYRFPKDYAALAYLSQLNQAYCMQVGVEHYRRNQPRCAGTLYWQFNDCWPVASWSSLEFGGRWKALHHAARRFYAPVLVSAHVPGDETIGIGNRLKSTVREVHLHTICDLPEGVRGVLSWELHQLGGGVVLHGKKGVALRAGESVRQTTLDLSEPIEKFGRENIYLRIALEVGGECVSEETVLLCPPRAMELVRAKPQVELAQEGDGWLVSITSPVFQHRLAIEVEGLRLAAMSDNWFDLYPGRTKTVTMSFGKAVSKAAVQKALRLRSLVDSYE